MADSEDALRILQSLVRRTRNARVAYQALIAYAEKYLASAAEEDQSLEVFADNPADLMAAFLVQLEEAGKVSLTYSEGAISSVFYPDYYRRLIHDVYERLDQRPDGPFPGDDALAIPIPNDLVTAIDIKTDFVSWLGRSENEPDAILRIMFPEDIHSMIVSSDLLENQLPRMAVQKIRQYLRSEKNVGYIRSKLSGVFRQREMAMKDMLSSILTTPDQALRSIFKPTDFTFHFWTQLSSTIIKEYSQKKDKLVEEHGHCQAAYMIGYYNVYHRGVLQRQRDADSALRALESKLRRAPFTYTISEIHGFTDSRGVPLTKKYSLGDVNSYIGDRLKTEEGRGLSQMIRLKTSEGKEYYLYKDYIFTVALEQVFESRREFRDHYVDAWSSALKARKKVPEMTDDRRFRKSVEDRLKEANPLLSSLLNFNLLYLARQESTIPGELADEVADLFDDKGAALRPVPEILNLDRRKLYSDARLLLPFWLAIPLLSRIVGLLKRIFVGRHDEEPAAEPRKPKRVVTRSGRSTTMRFGTDSGESEMNSDDGRLPGPVSAPAAAAPGDRASRKAQVARFKEAVRQLQHSYVRPGSTPEKTLNELIERWNPLLDPVAKENLVEDINSLARDFLRRMKVSFRLVPPNRERVQEWADRLARNEAFDQIRRRDDLMEYLKLYMLTVLGK